MTLLGMLHLVSQAKQEGESVLITSWAEATAFYTLGVASAGFATYYRNSRCSQTDCRSRLRLRRHGRYPHGHLKLCHVHHPLVPSDGVVTAAHVAAVQQNTSSKQS
jgi:hypothetical protein